MIRCILFDIDNTLMNFRACAQVAVQNAFSLWGLPYTAAVYETFDRMNEAMWRQIERGELTKAEHAQVRWQRIFDALRIEANGLAFEPVFQQALRETGVPNAGAIELLSALQGKYTLCAASNAPYAQQVSRLRNSGMLEYFTHLFISERIGYMKPDVRFFGTCHAALGMPPKEEMLMVGDSLTADIAGGEAFGMQTCWFAPDGAECPPQYHPTYIVRSLSEILQFL